MTMIDDTKAAQQVVPEKVASSETLFLGVAPLIFLPATTSDRTRGFDEITGEMFSGGAAYASIAVDPALAATLEASATICARSHDPETPVHIRTAPDCWGGSLEDETILSCRLVVNQSECWFVGRTEDYVEVRTLSYPVKEIVAALKGQKSINFFDA